MCLLNIGIIKYGTYQYLGFIVLFNFYFLSIYLYNCDIIYQWNFLNVFDLKIVQILILSYEYKKE